MKSEIFADTYLFHFHTTFTDGHITIPEYFEFAVESGVNRLIFLEHVRRVPSYSVSDFLKLIAIASEKYDMLYSIGFEAKILPDGTLDISNDQIDIADVIGIAEHGSFTDLCQMKNTLYQVIDKYSFLAHDKEIVWVHPGLFLKRHHLLIAEADWYNKALQYAVTKGIKIERNLKYQLISSDISTKMCCDTVVIGADAHILSDLETWMRFIGFSCCR
jgi:DNA polymerase (family 10)/putative hydrolase